MLFTSCLYSFRVPKSADSFLLLPRRTRICQFLGSSGVRAVTSGPGLESRWAAPVTRGGEPGALRAGDVLALARRGAQGRPGHAAGQASAGSVGFVPRAVPDTIPAGRVPNG